MSPLRISWVSRWLEGRFSIDNFTRSFLGTTSTMDDGAGSRKRGTVRVTFATLCPKAVCAGFSGGDGGLAHEGDARVAELGERTIGGGACHPGGEVQQHGGREPGARRVDGGRPHAVI